MSGPFKNHVPRSEIASFTSHLAEFVLAGVPLLKSLELLQKESSHPYFKEVLQDVTSRVRRGENFSEALKRYPRLFGPVYGNLIQAGEAGGKLEGVLARLSTALEKEIELKNKVGQALAYPALVFLFGIGTVIFLMIFIVPKISAIYTEFGGHFPLPTRIVLAVSHLFLNYGWIVFVVIAGLTGYAVIRRELSFFKRFADRLLLGIPWVSRLVLEADISRFSSTLGTLLQSGVPLLQALELARQTVSNGEIKNRLGGIEAAVSQGKSLSETLRQKNFFPELALNLIWVGESTGKLDQSLAKLGDIADRQVDRQMKILTTLLEPVIIIAVGLIVAFIVISLLLPIFEMSLLVK